jgi:hypothetical protein
MAMLPNLLPRLVAGQTGSFLDCVWLDTALDCDPKPIQSVRSARLFLQSFGTKVGQKGFRSFFDFDGNGTINGVDLAQFLARFGTTIMT